MPDIWMDVDTALSEVPVNLMPLVDDTDFKTIEGAVAYNAAGMTLRWHFVTTGGAYTVTSVTPTTAGNYDWTDQGDSGIYTIEIPASGGASINNDTEGFGWFTGVATGILPWRGPVIGFRAAALNNLLIDDAFSTTRGLAGTALPNAAADAAGGLPISDAGGLDLDAKIGALTFTVAGDLDVNIQSIGGAALSTTTAQLGVNVVQLSGDATAADNAESFFDGTGYAGTNNVIPTVTTLTGHTAQTGDAYAIVNSGTHGNAAINTKLGTPSDLGNGATIAFNLSDIHTDTASIDAIASKLSGLVMASEVIGSTGNSTTAIHLSTLTYGNDEINDHLLVIYDNSTGEFHSRWVTAWSNASKLATVATLPFTPENAVDTYYLTSIRRDMTAATVSDKTGYALSSSGMDSVTLPANLITATSIANDAITAAKIANGAIDAATFAADVDAEILSYLVDDATRIDASALNTATVTTIPAILDDTDLIDDGTSGLAKIATDVAAILVDTAVIGALGAGLTAIIGADGDTLKSLSDQIDGLSTSAAPQLLLNTTIATLATQTSFTLTAGSADNDAYNGAIIVVTDQSTATQKAVGTISDYVGASKTITLSADPAIFTMAVGDTVDILAAIGSAPTVTQIRQEIDSNSTQLAAIVADTNELQTDWANGGRLDLLLDATLADTNELQTDWVNGGRLDLLLDATLADTNELQTDWANGGRLDLIVDAILVDTAEIGAAGAGLTAIQLPSNGLANVTAWTVAITGNITGNLSGSVGSVSGAVGSVTGNVGGNVTGSVGSVLGGINTTAGVITTLDGLDTAQDTQHSTTQGLVTTVDTVVDSILVDTTQIKADLPTRPTKNVALANFPFVMRLTSDHVTGATGKTVTATRRIDNGSFASCANSASEVSNGVYTINLAAADLNGDTILLRFAAADCDDTFILVVTQP